jgi:hypothetical protein
LIADLWGKPMTAQQRTKISQDLKRAGNDLQNDRKAGCAMASQPLEGQLIRREEIFSFSKREGRMRKTGRPVINPIIIYHNVREEFHLTMIEHNGGKFVDLRTCIRDPKRDRVIPTGNGITVHVEMWSYFITAIGSPETWIEPLPFWNQQKTREFGRGRLVFPDEALQKIPQEQIFLEHKNFQGIPFIFLKTVARTTRGRLLSLITLGPLLWSQLMRGLSKMEEALIEYGWLVEKTGELKDNLNLSTHPEASSSEGSPGE